MASMMKRNPTAWYETLFGIVEGSSAVQSNFSVDFANGVMTSAANNKSFQIGQFSTPSLNSLRELGRSKLADTCSNVESSVPFSFEHVIQGDVLLEHAKHPGAVFQAASQFNCLEFSNWKATPEQGVTWYSSDPTQGPACALACAAGTVVRNYFVNVPDHSHTGGSDTERRIGQYRDLQIDNLDALEVALNNQDEKYFNILNGYSFSAGAEPLARLSAVIEASKQAPPSQPSYEDLMGLVKIGLHADVGVTFRTRFEGVVDVSEGLTVTQAYCSALSCAYSGIATAHWASFAKLVLDATYEATLWAAVLNAVRADNSTPIVANVGGTETREFPAPSQAHKHDVFLSFIGGGVFGNDPEWISDAIGRALAIMHKHNAPIRVHIAHFRRIDDQYVHFIERAYRRHLENV